MKKKILLYSIIIIAFVCGSQILKAQTGRATISQVNNGSSIDVSIYLRNTGVNPWSLGFASFVVSFNRNAMDSSVELVEGIWDNNANTEYDDQFIATYGSGNSKSIEIGLNSIPSSGTIVPDDTALVGTIRFRILDPTANHNLRWSLPFCAVLDNNGNDVTGGITFSDPENTLLPVELSAFTALTQSNNVVLNWTTSQELNNSGFTIERNKIDINSKVPRWQNLGFVNGSGNSNEVKRYEFKDKNVQSGKYQYRLKQMDYNGNFEYFNLSNDINVEIPLKFYLSQNYPNPFNPATVISYQIAINSLVVIKVFDNSGREITTLVNEFKEAGYYSFDFNASSLSSGVYFYRLEAGGNIIGTRRMMLVK